MNAGTIPRQFCCFFNNYNNAKLLTKYLPRSLMFQEHRPKWNVQWNFERRKQLSLVFGILLKTGGLTFKTSAKLLNLVPQTRACKTHSLQYLFLALLHFNCKVSIIQNTSFEFWIFEVILATLSVLNSAVVCAASSVIHNYYKERKKLVHSQREEICL